MLQRIQSIYLLIVVACSAALFFIPVAQFQIYSFGVKLFLTGIKADAAAGNLIQVSIVPILVLIIPILAGSLFTIFLFKKRILQVRINRIIFLLIIMFIVVLFLLTDTIRQRTGIAIQYNFIFAALLLIMLVCNFLASRAIKKDEELIKSADRLR